jgi:hypothetical protein
MTSPASMPHVPVVPAARLPRPHVGVRCDRRGNFMRKLVIALLGLAASGLYGCDPLNALHFTHTSAPAYTAAVPGTPV